MRQVKTRIVSDQNRSLAKGLKLFDDRLNGGCTHQISFADAGQLGRKRTQRLFGADKGRVFFDDLTFHDFDRRQFNQVIVSNRQACGLNVKHHKRRLKQFFVDVVGSNRNGFVVDKRAFHTINRLDGLMFDRIRKVRKRLQGIVVGNGNRRMTPSNRLFDIRTNVANAIHRAHLGMQMKFHTRSTRLELGLLFHHVFRLFHLHVHFVGIAVHLDQPTHLNDLPLNKNVIQNHRACLGFIAAKGFDFDRILLVRNEHIKQNRASLRDFFVDVKDVAFHDVFSRFEFIDLIRDHGNVGDRDELAFDRTRRQQSILFRAFHFFLGLEL